MKVSKTCFIQHSRIDDRRVVDLRGPGATRVAARHTRRVCATDRVLRVVVVKTIDIHAEHQILVRGELVIDTAVEEELSIVTNVFEISVGRQYKCRQRG